MKFRIFEIFKISVTRLLIFLLLLTPLFVYYEDAYSQGEFEGEFENLGSDISELDANSVARSVIESEGSTVVYGIVEENNPDFGYITLYREDGWGTSPQNAQILSIERTFVYSDIYSIEVFINHKIDSVNNLETGDSVFIRLDLAGNITGISAVKNYTHRYGTLLTLDKNYISIEYEDETHQTLSIDSNVKFYLSGVRIDTNTVKDGDKIRLVVNSNPKSTHVREIHIEDERFKITGIYKGTLAYIDTTSDKIILRNMEQLENGRWKICVQKGFSGILIPNDCRLYYDNNLIDKEYANKNLKGMEVYVAVRKEFGGVENAMMISFRNYRDSEIFYDDIIVNKSQKEIELLNSISSIKMTQDTMVIKDGRLTHAMSIAQQDKAYIVANRDYESGSFTAGIIEIKERFGIKALRVYRGRIIDIKANRNVTLESWSQFNGLRWTYNNTPKTFDITYDTRIVGADGVINNRSFIDFGQNSFRDTSVYIISKDEKALVISTAPYGNQFSSGEIYQLIFDDSRQITGFMLMDTANYDIEKYEWNSSTDLEVNLLSNSILIKNDEIIKPSDLMVGDRIGILKKDTSDTEDAYIVIVD